jgi:hypothetical protein
MALALSAHASRAFGRMAADFRRVLDDRFVALVAYAPTSGACFATPIDAADLEALAVLTEQWHREGLATPLIMTPEEFRRSLDTFPIEYQAMIDRHVVIAGRNPFEGAAVAADDLRRGCELQAKAHLIHLRQGWIEAGGHGDELAELIARSADPLRLLLGHLARLMGDPAAGVPALAAFAEREIGMPADLVTAVLQADQSVDAARAAVPRLSAYVAAAERLWAFVDEWREHA